MNVLGNFFQEAKLVDWVQTKHFNNPEMTVCEMEYAAAVPKCLLYYAGQVAIDKEVIIIPINQENAYYAQNLICSLEANGITNIVFWSLDLVTHESFLERHVFSIYLTGFPPIMDSIKKNGPEKLTYSHYKPQIIMMLLEAGFNVWFLSPDSIAMADFRPDVVKDMAVDVFFSIRTSTPAKKQLLPIIPHTPDTIVPSGGVLYFRNSVRSVEFVQMYIDMLHISNSIDDEQALRRVIGNTRRIHVLKHDQLAPPASSQSSIVVKMLNPILFCNGHMLFDKVPLPDKFGMPDFVHLGRVSTPKMSLSEWGLWFMTDDNRCEWLDPTAKFEAKLELKARRI